MMVDWTISGASGETDEPAKTQLLVYFQIVWTGKIIQQYLIEYNTQLLAYFSNSYTQRA